MKQLRHVKVELESYIWSENDDEAVEEFMNGLAEDIEDVIEDNMTITVIDEAGKYGAEK